MVDLLRSFDKIIDTISRKPCTLHHIVCATNLNPRTVRKYLAIIEKIQTSGKIKKEIRGFRVLFKNEL